MCSIAGISPNPMSAKHLNKMFNLVLQTHGRTLADAHLYHHPASLNEASIRKTVEQYCKRKTITNQNIIALYQGTITSFCLSPDQRHRDILINNVMAWAVAATYTLDAKAGALLRTYAERHVIYFDSNVIIRALAVGLDTQPEAAQAIHTTKRLKMQMKISQGIFNEVHVQINKAMRILEKAEAAGIRDYLATYLQESGDAEDCENLFVGGYIMYCRRNSVDLGWRDYFQQHIGVLPSKHMIGAMELENVLSRYHITLDNDSLSMEAESGIPDLVEDLKEMRSGERDNKNRSSILYENEARQFMAIVDLRRKTDRPLEIWFVTMDHIMLQLQMMYRKEYPVPIAYTPSGWLEYLGLVDSQHHTKVRKNFSRYLTNAYYALAVDAIGMTDLIKTPASGSTSGSATQSDMHARITTLHIQHIGDAMHRMMLERLARQLRKSRGESDSSEESA